MLKGGFWVVFALELGLEDAQGRGELWVYLCVNSGSLSGDSGFVLLLFSLSVGQGEKVLVFGLWVAGHGGDGELGLRPQGMVGGREVFGVSRRFEKK